MVDGILIDRVQDVNATDLRIHEGVRAMRLLKKCRPDGLAYEFYGRINFAFPQNTVLRPRSREVGK